MTGMGVDCRSRWASLEPWACLRSASLIRVLSPSVGAGQRLEPWPAKRPRVEPGLWRQIPFLQLAPSSIALQTRPELASLPPQILKP